MLNQVRQLTSLMELETTYLGFVVVLSMPSHQVQAMLPKKMVLGSQTITESGEHPIVLMFGENHAPHLESRSSFLSRLDGYAEQVATLLDPDYMAFSVTVPFVQWANEVRQGPSVFSFMPRIFVNKTLPFLAGMFYGFAIKEASIGIDKSKYIVNDLKSNSPLIVGTFRLKGRAQLSAQFPLFKDHMFDLFKEDYVSQTRLNTFVHTTCKWNFETAIIQAARAEIEVGPAFLPDLPTDETITKPSIDVNSLGAFQLSAQWRLSAPVPLLF